MKVSIGEDENDPVFVITDLLVHLAQEQLEKKASQVIEGEKLDLLIGNRPIEKADDLKKEEKDAVKQNVLNILKEMYVSMKKISLFGGAGDRSGRKSP